MNTEKLSRLVCTFVISFVEPVTMIVGEPEMYINKESTMNLTCVVRHSPEPPLTIYWTHDHEVSEMPSIFFIPS